MSRTIVVIAILMSACVNTHPIEITVDASRLPNGTAIGLRVADGSCPVSASSIIRAQARLEILPAPASRGGAILEFG